MKNLRRRSLVLAAPAALAQSRIATREITAAEVIIGVVDPGAKATANVASASRAITPPVLDGRTNDPAWASAQVIDQFLQYDPGEGKASRFRTEVRVTLR